MSLRTAVPFSRAAPFIRVFLVIDIAWKARILRLDPGTTKNGDGRSFPFTAEIEKVLKEQLAIHDTQESRHDLPFRVPSRRRVHSLLPRRVEERLQGRRLSRRPGA